MWKNMFWKAILPIVIVMVIGLFGYRKYQEFKFQHKQEIDTINKELAARDEALNKARTEVVSSVEIKNIVTKLQQDYIKQKKLLAKQHAEIVALYKVAGGGNAIPIGESPVLKPESTVIVDNNIVKNWILSYKDFRIDIDADVLKQKLNYNLHQSFSVDVIKATNEHGGVAFFANAFELDDKGNKVGELQIKEFNVKEVTPNKKKLRWLGAPLQMGLNVGAAKGEITPQVFMAYPIATYGYTTVDTTWVAGPYVGSNGDVHSGGLYFGYDVGELINVNLFRGTKIGIMGGYSTDGAIIGLGISK